jgi:tetratricopeptide (TPR) repeat protein
MRFHSDSPPATGAAAGARRLLPAALLLFAVVCLPYLQTMGFDFVLYDDGEYVFANPVVRHGLSWHSLGWAFTSRVVANWHPLTSVSLMADVSLFGVSPGAMHAVNALFHAAAAVVLLLVLHRLTGCVEAALVAAAFWALHPLRVESVAWISERKDVLSTLLGLLAVFFHLCAVLPRTEPEDGGRGCRAGARLASRLLAVALFALAFMAKPAVVTFPLLVAMLEYAWLGRVCWRHLEIPVWMAVCGGIVTVYVQGISGAMSEAGGLSLAMRFLNAVASVGAYVRQTLLPAKLAAFYPYRWPVPPAVLLAGVLACACLGALFWRAALSRLSRERGPAGADGANRQSLLPYAAGIGWFLVALAPMIGIVQVGSQAHADRYTYWPSIGIAVGLAWGLAPLFRQDRRAAVCAWALALPVLCALFAASVRQAARWRNTETLLGWTASVTERNALAHGNLGIYLCLHGRAPEGVPHLRTVAALAPTPSNLADLAWGLALADRWQEAVELARQARESSPSESKAWFVLGMEALHRGANSDAELLIRRTLNLVPSDPLVWQVYGAVFAAQGRWPEAVSAWQRAEELYPDVASLSSGVFQRADWRGLAAEPPGWRSLIGARE